MWLLLLSVSLPSVNSPPIKLFIILVALLPKVFSPFLLFLESSPSASGWYSASSGTWSKSCVTESKLTLLAEQQANESETRCWGKDYDFIPKASWPSSLGLDAIFFYRWRDRGEGRLNGLLSTEELGTEFSVGYTRLQSILVDQKAQLRISGNWVKTMEVNMNTSLLPTF